VHEQVSPYLVPAGVGRDEGGHSIGLKDDATEEGAIQRDAEAQTSLEEEFFPDEQTSPQDGMLQETPDDNDVGDDHVNASLTEGEEGEDVDEACSFRVVLDIDLDSSRNQLEGQDERGSTASLNRQSRLLAVFFRSTPCHVYAHMLLAMTMLFQSSDKKQTGM